MSDEHQRLLAEAANPRRAGIDDARRLARLLAAAFLSDPVIDWIARPGRKRAGGLERFFFWLLTARAIPLGQTWMAASGSAAAVWMPPDAPPAADTLIEQIRLMPIFLRLCGLPRVLRGQAVAAAVERHRPANPHFHLAFIAVAPRLQGQGLGSAILGASLARVDAIGAAAYLENSNPRNTRFYKSAGFVARGNFAPVGAPPLLAMWRPARPRLTQPTGERQMAFTE